MKQIKILSLALALIMCLAAFAGCAKKNDKDDGTGTASEDGTRGPVEFQPIDPADAVEHKDFTSVYDKIGKKVTIDMVTEKDGLAFVTVDGKEYELGMDFLSMAMVYNTQVPAGGKYKTSEDVYNQWWKLYIQRWNWLAPEVPLYSNIYYDLYNAKISNFVTSPYWQPAAAIVGAKSSDGHAILGSATDLSGMFRNSSWGKSSPAASDLDVQDLISGHATLITDKSGAYVWNEYVVDGVPTSKVNDDGTVTYTIKIKQDLKFSDGSPITAKNYIVGVLTDSSPVGLEAGGKGMAGQHFVGFNEFKKYDGTGDKVYFQGVKMLNDYEFSVDVIKDDADYYYAMTYAGFSPDPLALYLGNAEGVDVIVDEKTKACGLTDNFYEKVDKDGKKVFARAAEINANMKWNSGLPFSGPYVVSNYNESSLTAELKLNPNYPGDTTRGKPSIETITYIKVVDETQMDMFKKGQVDVVAGITGGDATKAALKMVSENPSKYKETHYDRAGYGKMGFRADFGPSAFREVRQAIMYTINRPEFAQTFTGGFGSVVHGPYYTGYSAFQAVKDEILLNQYNYSADAANEVLTEGGWIYNEDGSAYDIAKGGIRYKKLEGYEKTKDNLNFHSTDNKYKTVKVNGEYYMPLAINWYGTQPNEVTDLLITSWQKTDNATKNIGMYITYTSTEFQPGLYGELMHMEEFGYKGTPTLNAINFATGFTSAVYDYAFNWSIKPEFADYQACYILDEADFFENYK